MKSTRLLALSVLAAMLLVACEKKKTERDIWVMPEHEVITRRMPDLRLTDSTVCGSNTYTYEIERVPNDSLPKVTDDMDDLFCDNTIRLTLHRNGTLYFDRTFTKSIFASSIDDNFYQNAILDGIRFMKAETGQGLTFSFAVSYPESDMSVAFLLTITDQGTYSFVKDDNLDREESDSIFLTNFSIPLKQKL